MARLIVCLVLVVACAEKPTPTPTPTPSTVTTTNEREMKLVVERCLPVGYGERCAGTVDGRAVSLQACVGRESVDGLMHQLEGAPIAGQDGGQLVTLALATKYVGVLDAAYSSDYCGGLLFEGSKEQFHVVRVLAR